MNAPATRTEMIASRIDAEAAKGMALKPLAGGAAVVPQTLSQVMELAKMMAVSGIAVRKHMRDNPGVCAAICMQAARWEMDPFSVGNKSFVVNDQVAYESQLITAVINTRAPIRGRLKTRFIGVGESRKCIAYATFVGDDEPTEVESPEIGKITPKNSPLWKTDPDQQLAYYTKRLWARRECPEILLGVYDVEELSEPQSMRDVTPPPRPTRAEFQQAEPNVTDLPDEPDDERAAAMQSRLDAVEAAADTGDLASMQQDWREAHKAGDLSDDEWAALDAACKARFAVLRAA